MTVSDLYETLLTQQDGDLRWVTLNRPAVLNAFDLTQWQELRRAIETAEEDPSVRVVALRGAGQGFSAGYDLTAAMSVLVTDEGPASPNAWRDYVHVGNAACWAIWESKKPVIAAVHGYCLGGAFELAMACDFVVSSADAVFGEPEVRLADAPPFLISPWVMGMRQAKDVLLTGDLISAEKAQQFGILSQVCAPDDLEAEVQRLARKLAAFPLETWRLNKLAVNRSYEIMGFRAAIDMGAEMFATTNLVPTELKTGFAERIRREGLSTALKWAQSRYTEDHA